MSHSSLHSIARYLVAGTLRTGKANGDDTTHTHKQLSASPRVIPRPEISNPEFLHAGPTRPQHEVRCGLDLLRRLASWLQATPQAATGCSDHLELLSPIDAMHALWRRPTGVGNELGLLGLFSVMCARVVSAGGFGTPRPTAT